MIIIVGAPPPSLSLHPSFNVQLREWLCISIFRGTGGPTKRITGTHLYPSSETQGQLVGAEGKKSGKEMKHRMFTSKAEKAPGNRLLPDHFQTALPMLSPDWAEKSFVLFCPIGEQQLLRYYGVFLHDGYRIAITWFVHQHPACGGNFHFNFPRRRHL